MKKNFYTFFLLTSFLSLTSRIQAQPTGYLYVRDILINESQIPDGANLNNFPVLVKITHPDLRSVANGGHVASSSGHDIAFYRNSCSDLLDYQLEDYNPITGDLTVWVRIPVLSTTADTRIYMYYGNSSISSSGSTSNTWDANYSAVWHLSNDPTGATPQIADATVNGHNGTAYGSMTAASLVTGKIGKALSFDELNDYVRIPDFLYGQELTVSFWFNASEMNGNSYQYLFSHGVWGAQNSLNVYAGEDNITIASEIPNRLMLKSVFRDNNDANNYDTLNAGTTFIDGNWHYYTCRIQDFGGATIYIDGSQVAVYAVWGANLFDPPTDIFLGGREDLNPGRFYGGLLDEVRISTTWRTSNWIRTEYNNQQDPGTFYTVGPEGGGLSFCFPLALRVTDFTASRFGEEVRLQWSTANQPDTVRFTVERSVNGTAWDSIGSTCNENHFTDTFSPAGILFYRIRYKYQSTSYTSPVRKVEAVCCNKEIRIYPNPSVDGNFLIDFPNDDMPAQVSLLNAAGKFIKGISLERKNKRTYRLKTIQELTKGLYLLRFQYRNTAETVKLMVR